MKRLGRRSPVGIHIPGQHGLRFGGFLKAFDQSAALTDGRFKI